MVATALPGSDSVAADCRSCTSALKTAGSMAPDPAAGGEGEVVVKSRRGHVLKGEEDEDDCNATNDDRAYGYEDEVNGRLRAKRRDKWSLCISENLIINNSPDV